MCGLSGSEWIQLVQAIVWPIVALVGIVALLWFASSAQGRTLARWASRRVGKVSAGSFSLELKDGAAAGTVKTDVETTFRQFRLEIKSGFDLSVDKYRVADYHQQVMDMLCQRAKNPGERPRRSTIYVPDTLFRDALYQLVDYRPGNGGARGRIFSIRYGIIGRTWRHQKSVVETVPSDEQQLMDQWGMTRTEAQAKTAALLLCIVLKPTPDALPVGILFIEFPENRLAGKEREEFLNHVDEHADTVSLANAVASATKEMRARGPMIRIFQN